MQIYSQGQVCTFGEGKSKVVKTTRKKSYEQGGKKYAHAGLRAVSRLYSSESVVHMLYIFSAVCCVKCGMGVRFFCLFDDALGLIYDVGYVVFSLLVF